MNPYRKFVADFARLTSEAKGYALGTFPPAPRPVEAPRAPRLLIFSPHPDDECIFGALPLRLMREAGMRVTAVAVTQGSRKDRQKARFEELTRACEHLGFGVIQVKEGGLEKINPKGRQADPENWAQGVEAIARIVETHRPDILMMPHDSELNTTHVGTHYLVMDALKRVGAFAGYIVEAEFWQPMTAPNLMVESSQDDVADLITALTFHVGEVQRNPYHLGLPAWLMDNVRRGAEIVGSQGGQAPDYAFATLYRVRRWRDGALADAYAGGKRFSCRESLDGLFPL